MKKGIRGHDAPVNGLINICNWCKRNDISYLQLVLEKTVDGFKFGDFTEEYANSIKEQLGEIKISVLGSYINPTNPNYDELRFDIERFKEKIKYASVLKPIVVGTETGMYKDNMTDTEEAYEYLLSNLKEIVSEAEKYDVCIGIEGVHCFVINTPEKMKRLLDDLNSDNVKVILDPVNYIDINNYDKQREILKKSFELFSDKICAIHIKDFSIIDGNKKAEIPFEGELDFAYLFSLINEYKVDVPLICEEYCADKAVGIFEKLSKL